MENILNSLTAFFGGYSVWVYMFIFFGKITEVSLSTLRIVLISRGERLAGSSIAVFEATIWLFVTGTVLASFQNDLLKIIVFVLAFALGNFLGSVIEEKLAFGMCSVQVMIPCGDEADLLADMLRVKGFGITSMEARGQENKMQVLLLMLKRKHANEAVDLIEEHSQDAVITISDIKSQKGGYFRNGSGILPFIRIGKKD